jgi:uncharacterized protein (DUF1501 family)
MAHRPVLSRRDWLRLSGAGVVGWSMSGWLETLAADAAENPQRRRSCILLWMSGGPSQTDTFDLKPGHRNGGPFKEIATTAPGIKISEHLPQIAKHMDRMALIRSMSTKEGDHERATFVLRTGQVPRGPIQYPPLGALLAKELEGDDAELPSFVSIAPYRQISPPAFEPGFLGPRYAPLVVGEAGPGSVGSGPNGYEQSLKVQDLNLPPGISGAQAEARARLLEDLEKDFVKGRPGLASQSHYTTCLRAMRLMRSAGSKVFNFEDEPAAVRDAYGRNQFGQGCLLARRLVERGVPFVEVTLGASDGQTLAWDTHGQNFDTVKRLSQVLDPAWATLMEDLKKRGLLDTTLIVWMGEFGRTPQINGGQGRDHFPTAWTTVLAGGGIRGGQVVGNTGASGMAVEDRPVAVADFLATICLALGIDPKKQNMSNVGRPIRLVDLSAKPIEEVVA